MATVQVWAWVAGEDQHGNPIIEKHLPREGFTPPDQAWLAEQDAEAWWQEIMETGKGKKYLGHLAEILNDGRQPSWVVSPRQFRLALNQLGLRAAIEDFIATQSQDVKDTWEYAVTIDRYYPLLGALAQQLGITAQQLNSIFELAETL